METEAFERLIAEVRPQLHRYCARMTGSVLDGEDVLQETLIKALKSSSRMEDIQNPRAWLFQIAHNTALDFLRRAARSESTSIERDVEVTAGPEDTIMERQAVATSLATFMRLPVIQRSSVILKDVLSYSVGEVAEIVDVTVPAVKSALQRGRERLRELAREPEDQPGVDLAEPDRVRLAAYVDRFNARDFEAVRTMLADDVRLDLVNRLQFQGRAKVGEYFGGYDAANNWRFVAGVVEGRPAVLVLDPNDLEGPLRYFIIVQWEREKVSIIRDFLFADYALEGARIRRSTDSF